MLKRCARCDVEFGCAAPARCWCEDVATTVATLERLRVAHDDCLCPACLRDEALCNLGQAVIDPPHGTPAA